MKVDTLAPSLFADVLSHNGETYCALLEVGTGLVVLRWPDGYPDRDVIVWIDAKATTHGFARLTQFNGDVFVAYRRDWPEPEHVVAVDLTTGVVAPWTVPCWGMHPLSWGMGGLLAVTADLGSVKRVLVANWPDRPRESPLSRDATQAPTGISRITGQKVIFWHEEPQEPLFQNRVWTPDITGSCGVTFDDRVMVDILGKRGQVLAGHAYKAPRIAREGNGAYTVASHREGSQGPTGVEIVTGITQADLVMPVDELPPVESVPLLGRPFGLACYTFNGARTLGNIELPIRPDSIAPQMGMTIPTVDDVEYVEDSELFAVYSGEAPSVPAETAISFARTFGHIRYRGLLIGPDHEPMRDTVTALVDKPDIASPRCYRNAGEPLADYRARLKHEYLRVKAELPKGAECWPTVNIHQRYSGTTPTLSEKDVVEGFIAACERAHADSWPGMVLFRIGTSDCPIDTLRPYLARFMSGITGTPAARVIEPDPPEPEPEEPAVIYLNKDRKPSDPVGISETELLGEKVAQPNGGFAIKAKNGKWKTLRPDKTWDDNATEIREWEKFYPNKQGGGTLAPNREGKTFWLETVED